MVEVAPRFEMRGIRKTFGATVALNGVDLSVRPGEICALVGENGAGKSTLMAILSGALAPDAGAMTIDGRPFAPRSPIDARRAGVAMIYQELSLAPHLTVMENILLGMEPTRGGLLDWGRMRRAAGAALAELGHGEIRPDARVESLAVASQQLVEIARAIAVGCRVLVLDEPTSSLGRDDAARLFDLVRRLRDQGHAIVYISHFIEEVQALADRFVVLRDGANAGGGDIRGATHDSIVALMVGRRVDDLFPRSPRRRGEAILEVEGVDPGGATFTLHRGEILGIAGLVGAGRTRLVRTIFGLEPVRRGRVKIAAIAGGGSPAARWRQGAGLLSEDRKGEGLAGALGVADNLTLTRLDRYGSYGLLSRSRQRSAARTWIERLGIRCADADQPAVELSGGNQQKVALARLLHHDVDVLILDEPTRGIDVASKAQIYALIDDLVANGDAAGRPHRAAPTRGLDEAPVQHAAASASSTTGASSAADAGTAAGASAAGASPAADVGTATSTVVGAALRGRPKAVLVVSSYLPELLGLCDRIAVMHRGRLGPVRDIGDVTEHSLMMEATGGATAA